MGKTGLEYLAICLSVGPVLSALTLLLSKGTASNS